MDIIWYNSLLVCRWLFHCISWRQSIHQQAKSNQLKNISRWSQLTTMNSGLWALYTMTVLWNIFKKYCTSPSPSPTACDEYKSKPLPSYSSGIMLARHLRSRNRAGYGIYQLMWMLYFLLFVKLLWCICY